jgi:sporulation protein YlmC with PRC-barrel domain
MRLQLGSLVHCGDGTFGELADLVIEPIKKRVTHLVVEPHRKHRLARLAPVELVTPTHDSSAEIWLACTLEEAIRLPLVQEFGYLRMYEPPVSDPDFDVGVQDVLAMPVGTTFGFDTSLGTYDPHMSFTYHEIPKGDVEIRHSSDVTTSDDERVGHVDALVVDDDKQVTYLLLERGHLWARHELAIPIGAVAQIETDQITLSLGKDELLARADDHASHWGDREGVVARTSAEE